MLKMVSVSVLLYIERLRYQALIALPGFFLVPSTFLIKKITKHVKYIKNVLISK